MKRDKKVKAHKRKAYTRLVKGKIQNVNASKVGSYRRQIEEEKKKSKLATGVAIGSVVLATTVLGVALSKGLVKANTFKSNVPKKIDQLDNVVKETSTKVSKSKATKESKDILSSQVKSLQDDVVKLKSEKDTVIRQYDDIFSQHNKLVDQVKKQEITAKELSKSNADLLNNLNAANRRNQEVTTRVKQITDDLSEVNIRLTEGSYLKDGGKGVLVDVEGALKAVTDDITKSESVRNRLQKQLKSLNTRVLDDILPTESIQLGKVRGKFIEDDILASLFKSTDAADIEKFNSFTSSLTTKKVGFISSAKGTGEKLEGFFNAGLNPETGVIEISNLTNLNSKNTTFTKTLLNKISGYSVASGNSGKVIIRVKDVDDPVLEKIKKNLRAIDTDKKTYEYIPEIQNNLDIKQAFKTKGLPTNFAQTDNTVEAITRIDNSLDNVQVKVEKQIEAYMTLLNNKNYIQSQATSLHNSNLVQAKTGMKTVLEKNIPRIESEINLLGLRMYKQNPKIYDELLKYGSQAYESKLKNRVLKPSIDISLLERYNDLSRKAANYRKIQSELVNKGIVLSEESIEAQKSQYQKQILKDWVENNIDNTKLLPISQKKNLKIVSTKELIENNLIVSGTVQKSIDQNSFKNFGILQTKPVFSNARRITVAQQRLDVFSRIEGKLTMGLSSAAKEIQDESLRLKNLLHRGKRVDKRLNSIENTIDDYINLNKRSSLGEIKETTNINYFEKLAESSEDLYSHTYFTSSGFRRKEITQLIKDEQKLVNDSLTLLKKEREKVKSINRKNLEKNLNDIESLLNKKYKGNKIESVIDSTLLTLKEENTAILGNHQRAILSDLEKELSRLGDKSRLDVFQRVTRLKERSKGLVQSDIYVNKLEKKILELEKTKERLDRLPKNRIINKDLQGKYEKVKSVDKDIKARIQADDILIRQRTQRFNEFLELDKEIKDFAKKRIPQIEKEIDKTLSYISKDLAIEIAKEEANTEKALNKLFATYLKRESFLKNMRLKDGVGDVFLVNHLRDTEVLENIATTQFNMQSNPYITSLRKMNALGSFTGEGAKKSGEVGRNYFRVRSKIFNKVKDSISETYVPYEGGSSVKGVLGEILEYTDDIPRQKLVNSRNKIKTHIEELSTLKANLQWYKNKLAGYDDLISSKELQTNLTKIQGKVDDAVLSLDKEYKELSKDIKAYKKLYNVRHELGRSFGKNIETNSELIQDVVTLDKVKEIVQSKKAILDTQKLEDITSFTESYLKTVKGLKNRTKYPQSLEAYEEFIGKHISYKNKVIHTDDDIRELKKLFPGVKNIKTVNRDLNVNFYEIDKISKKYNIPNMDLIMWLKNYHEIKGDDVDRLILGKKLSTYKNYVKNSKELENVRASKTKIHTRYLELKETLKTKYGYDIPTNIPQGGIEEALIDIEPNKSRWPKGRPSPNRLLAEISHLIGFKSYLTNEVTAPNKGSYYELVDIEDKIINTLNELHNQILI
jgi:hypothetical protein